MSQGNKVNVVIIDASLKDLMPKFFELTIKDLESLKAMVKASNYEEISSMAHTLKGDFGNYGFMELSQAAAEIETLVESKQISLILEKVMKIETYFNNIEVKYK